MRKRAMIMLAFFGGFLVFLLPGIFLINISGYEVLGGILLAISLLTMAANLIYSFTGGIRPLWVKQVMQSGAEARAIIIENNAMKGIGGYKGGDIWLDLPVRVLPANESAFEAQMKCRLTQTMMLRDGNEVSVRYDPSNKKRVVLMGDARTDMMTKYMK